jgi:hypothetical protein
MLARYPLKILNFNHTYYTIFLDFIKYFGDVSLVTSHQLERTLQLFM